MNFIFQRNIRIEGKFYNLKISVKKSGEVLTFIDGVLQPNEYPKEEGKK